MALKMLRPYLKSAPLGIAKVPEKKADPYYHTTDWKQLRADVLQRDGFQCVICSEPAIIVDHIKRRRDGGTDSMSNLRSLCRTCDNRAKEGWDGQRHGQRSP